MDKKSESKVLAAYKTRYQTWKDIKIVDSFPMKKGGYFVVVEADQCPDGEICFYESGKPHIFGSTVDLARRLEEINKNKTPTGLYFMFALSSVVVGLFVYIVIARPENKEAVTAVISGFVGIVGYFSGSKYACIK